MSRHSETETTSLVSSAPAASGAASSEKEETHLAMDVFEKLDVDHTLVTQAIPSDRTVTT